jgi:hypothetical protein
VELDGIALGAGGYLIVCSNKTAFDATFGPSMTCDISNGKGGPAASNGNDQIAIIDRDEQIIDIFGVVGEDGRGTEHYFRNGRAVRNPSATLPSNTWMAAEWTTYANDAPAPGNFRPGQWIGDVSLPPLPLQWALTNIDASAGMLTKTDGSNAGYDAHAVSLDAVTQVIMSAPPKDPTNTKYVRLCLTANKNDDERCPNGVMAGTWPWGANYIMCGGKSGLYNGSSIENDRLALTADASGTITVSRNRDVIRTCRSQGTGKLYAKAFIYARDASIKEPVLVSSVSNSPPIVSPSTPPMPSPPPSAKPSPPVPPHWVGCGASA